MKKHLKNIQSELIKYWITNITNQEIKTFLLIMFNLSWKEIYNIMKKNNKVIELIIIIRYLKRNMTLDFIEEIIDY